MIVLIGVCDYLMFFAEAFVCCLFCRSFADKKVGGFYLKALPLSAAFSVLITALNIYDSFSFADTIGVLILLIILQWLIFRESCARLAAAVVVFRAAVTAVAFLVCTVLTSIWGQSNILRFSSDNPQQAVAVFAYELTACVLMWLAGKYTNAYTLKKRHIKITALTLSAAIILSEIISDITQPDSVNYCFVSYDHSVISTVILCLALLAAVFLFYYIIRSVDDSFYSQRLTLAEMKNSMLKASLRETEQSFGIWQKSVHDYKNNIIALTQLAEDGRLDEIKSYLNEENKLLDKRTFYIKTGNSVADAVINTKYKSAAEKNISFTVNAELNEGCKIKDTDLANILGNLIDNAVEASANETEPYIDVVIGRQKSFLIIKVTNKFTGEFSTSTSKDNPELHGIGIDSVRAVAEKYGGELNITCSDNEVCAKAILFE